MLRIARMVGFAVVIAAMLWPLGLVRAEDPPALPEGTTLVDRIEQLARELDAEDFHAREAATDALIEIGEPARQRLFELADAPPSPEVKVRAGKILGALDLADLKRNALKLDDLFEQVRLANAGKLDGEKLELLLERLFVVLRDATGNDELKLPVKLADVKAAADADTSPRNALVVTRRGRVSFVRDSIVLADVAVDIRSASNSIIIARAGASVSTARNSVVIAGYDVRVSSARDNSILLSGGEVSATFPERTIIGAGETAQVSISREGLVLINTTVEDRHGRVAPTLVKTDGLILRSDEVEPDNPLADKITVTAAGHGDIVLFRRNARGGELVARLDKPIEHPDGGILPETAGWQACYAGVRSRGAKVIFTNGERFLALPVVRP